jgi:hypothetical protein
MHNEAFYFRQNELNPWVRKRNRIEFWMEIIIFNHHALNRDDGRYLPQEYLHLVGK